jgi:hypothetical protein
MILWFAKWLAVMAGKNLRETGFVLAKTVREPNFLARVRFAKRWGPGAAKTEKRRKQLSQTPIQTL